MRQLIHVLVHSVWLAAALGCGVDFTGNEATGAGSAAPSSSSGQAGAGIGGGTGGETSGGAPSAGGGGVRDPTGGGGTGGCGTLVIEATVADCIDVATPNPDACEAENGTGHMWIDTLLSTTGSARHAFIRFDPPAIPSGAVSAALSIRVSDSAVADADQTGELWEATPFTRLDLFSSVPSNVGNLPLGADQGAVIGGDIVSWPIPLSMLSAPVYLALRPITSSAPVYWNLNGLTVPIITVACAQ